MDPVSVASPAPARSVASSRSIRRRLALLEAIGLAFAAAVLLGAISGLAVGAGIAALTVIL